MLFLKLWLATLAQIWFNFGKFGKFRKSGKTRSLYTLKSAKFAQTHQTCQMPWHDTCPKCQSICQNHFLEKNEIRLAKFARVNSESGKCWANGHCLLFLGKISIEGAQFWVVLVQKFNWVSPSIQSTVKFIKHLKHRFSTCGTRTGVCKKLKGYIKFQVLLLFLNWGVRKYQKVENRHLKHQQR